MPGTGIHCQSKEFGIVYESDYISYISIYHSYICFSIKLSGNIAIHYLQNKWN